MNHKSRAFISKQHKKNQAAFVYSLTANQLIKQAKSRYQLAKKALGHVYTTNTKYYWKGYQDALLDILQQAGVPAYQMRHLQPPSSFFEK